MSEESEYYNIKAIKSGDNKPSYILVNFSEVGSVMLQLNIENCTPLQLLAAAAYLEVKGKNALVLEENARMQREAQQHLSVPEGSNKIVVASGR